MKTSELQDLLGGILGPLTLGGLRAGEQAALVADLSDEQYGILVRFLSGEQIETGADRYFKARRDEWAAEPVERVSEEDLEAFLDEDDGVIEIDNTPIPAPVREFNESGIKLF